MEFWGIEVKSGQPLKVEPASGMVLHLSQACLGESKKKQDNEIVRLYVKNGDQKIVLGNLSLEKFPQVSFDLVFKDEFELSHDWKHGSVHFAGYRAVTPEEESEDESDDDSDLGEPVPVHSLNNGALESKQVSKPKATGKLETGAAKPKVNFAEPSKTEQASDDSEDDDDFEDDEEGDSSEDEERANADNDDSDEDEDDSDEDEDESDDETPKKVESSRKRVADSATKTPTVNKKSKLATPQKTDGKKVSQHVATPHPAKQAGKTPASSSKSKQLGSVEKSNLLKFEGSGCFLWSWPFLCYVLIFLAVDFEEMSLEDGVDDKFPAGLRVLVVDDDPTCLKVLDTLLSKCQYNVTTTNQSKVALQLLRENKDKFDLVISDVYMPDMDGFKLLELIGLEMDLPVIMLSANGDTNLVMKGVKHGAVDYLIKPVRLQELKNIWQHVLRKNKTTDHQGNAAEGCGSDDVPGGSASHSKPDQDNRKRKDQSGDDGHGVEDDEHVGENGTRESRDGDTAGTQKRPRVIWSVDLHRKFVSAVDELGIERAFPKKILEIMNVDGLTRENVASHLQKYRLYLKRISESQRQTNSPPITESSSIFQNGLLGRGLAAPGYFAGSSSFQSPGMLNRFNPSTGLNNSPSPIIQTPNNAPNLNNSRSTLTRYQQLGLASNLSQNPNPSLLQGNSTLSSQIQLNRNSVVLPGQNNLLQTTGNAGGFNDQSSTFNATAPLNMQILGGMVGGNNSNLMYSSNNRSLNNGVAAAVQPPALPTPLQNDQLAPNHNQLMNNNQNPSVAAAAARIRKDLEYVLNGGLTPLDNSGGNMQMQTPLPVTGQEGLNGLQNTISTTSSNNVLNGLQNTFGTRSANNVMCNNYGLNTMVPAPNQNQNQGFPVAQNGALYSGNFSVSSSSAVANTITSTPLLQHNEIQSTGINARTGLEDDYLLEDFAANNGGSLEDIMNEILNQGTGGPPTDGALSGLDDELFQTHM